MQVCSRHAAKCKMKTHYFYQFPSSLAIGTDSQGAAVKMQTYIGIPVPGQVTSGVPLKLAHTHLTCWNSSLGLFSLNTFPRENKENIDLLVLRWWGDDYDQE